MILTIFGDIIKSHMKKQLQGTQLILHILAVTTNSDQYVFIAVFADEFIKTC